MSDFDRLMSAMSRRFAEMETEIEALKMRLNNMVREATVTGVDHDKATATVNADGLDSPQVPWLARSGAQREWDPVTKGERVLLISPTGDPGQGMIMPGGYSNAFRQPHQAPGTWFRDVGASSILMDGGKIVFTSGGSRLAITPGEIAITTPRFSGSRG